MSLRDPFAAYNASSNLEAHLVCGALIHAGIEAMVIEDVSTAGAWMFGLAPEIHKPQVWIERADIDRAKPVLDEYERQAAERRAADRAKRQFADEMIEVICEECGKSSKYPAVQQGSVQNCPKCKAYVDVGNEVEIDGWDEALDEGQPDT